MIEPFFDVQAQPDAPAFLALPSPANPRVLLPLGPRKLMRAAWQIHNTAAPLNRMLRRLLLAGAPLLPLLRSRRVYPTAAFRQLLADLQNALPEVNFSRVSVYVGTPGSANQKLTLQLMDEAGAIRGYLKLAEQNTPAAAYLQNEMQAVAFLSQRSLSGLGFPAQSRLLPLGKYLALYQEAVFEGASPCGYRLNRPLLRGALALADATQNTAGLPEFYRAKAAELDTLDLPAPLQELLQRSLQRLAEHAVPTVALHGDFVPYNLKIKAGELIAIDWEFFRERGLPLHDLLTYVVRGDLFIRKKTPLNSIKQVLSDKNKRHYFENYLKQLNINRILLKDLIVVVLVENLYLLKSLHKVDREYQLFIEPLYFLVNHK